MFGPMEAEQEATLAELRALEPIFHTRAFGLTASEREARVAPDYWEVGASGRRYGRAFIMQLLAETPPVDAEAAGWRCWDFGLRLVGAETYLLTYSLEQAGRITRRATVWQKAREGWRILFHQGTVVTGEAGTMP